MKMVGRYIKKLLYYSVRTLLVRVLAMLLQVSLFVILLASSGATPYYITSSDDIIAGNNTCSIERQSLQPCSTLETLAANYKSITSGEILALLFLPGNYVVQNMTHLKFTSFQMISLSPLNESGSIVRIKCDAEMTITFRNISIINISSLEFCSCGGKRGDFIKLVGSNDMTVRILDSSFIGTVITIIHQANAITSVINITNCIFVNNTSSYSRAALFIQSFPTMTLSVTVNHCSFVNNDVGAILMSIHSYNVFPSFDPIQSTIEIFYSSFSNNTAGAIVFRVDYISSYIAISNCNFTANTSPNGYGGAISFSQTLSELISTRLYLLNATFQKNSALRGGAIFARNTNMLLCDNSVFSYNTAESGGAISVENIFMEVYGNLNFIHNKANIEGGAIMAAGDKSEIVFDANIIFESNSAGSNGGALFLSTSLILFEDNLMTNFTSNTALRGGALYVKDSNEYCSENARPHFIESLSPNWKTHFKNNKAYKGSILYGGDLLGNCSIYDDLNKLGISSMAIASDAVNICFCNDESNPNCSMRHKEISAYKGELISFKVTTLTQCRNFSSSVISICEDSTLSLNNPNECYQNIHKHCKEVSLHIHSKQVLENFILKTEGPCKEKMKLNLSVSFKQCPPIFPLSPSGDRCECDKRLGNQDQNSMIQCDVQIIHKKENSWFGYRNGKLEMCNLCPLGYCSQTVINISESSLNGSQCANNRAGVVCGKCEESFSVALGNSRCIECFKRYNFLWLVPQFAVMGLILVLSMLFLNLTVSIGLINGLIFYANILSISGLTNNYNCSIHQLLSVFISWVNLDFGIETCFYSGIDMYQKTWLQFAFPLYIWLLVGLIIILSHYSTQVMRLLGRKVIPVLATLFLLSYIKILRIVITVFTSSEVLKGDAGNTSDKLVPCKVWTHDGNVDYLSGKHIPLFIVALLFLVVLFLPYTLLLIFGQCLRSLPRRKELRWLHSTAFVSIMDAYHAPFNRKHRYWTGLLLLIRCILLMVYVVTYFKDNAIETNIYIILIITMGLIILKASFKESVYQRLGMNIIENIFLLNLGILAATAYYLNDVNGPNNLYMCHSLTASISVALVTFLAIVACHIYFKMKGFNALKNIRLLLPGKSKLSKKIRLEDTPTVTTSFVELRETLLETEK